MCGAGITCAMCEYVGVRGHLWNPPFCGSGLDSVVGLGKPSLLIELPQLPLEQTTGILPCCMGHRVWTWSVSEEMLTFCPASKGDVAFEALVWDAGEGALAIHLEHGEKEFGFESGFLLWLPSAWKSPNTHISYYWRHQLAPESLGWKKMVLLNTAIRFDVLLLLLHVDQV